jgi:hypothetical protein
MEATRDALRRLGFLGPSAIAPLGPGPVYECECPLRIKQLSIANDRPATRRLPEAVDGADTVKVRAACPASTGLFGERKVWHRSQPRRNPACARPQRHIRVLITGFEETP